MPHILCTVTNDLSYDQRMQRICSSLAGAGYQVSLIGRERPSSPKLSAGPYRQIRLRCRFERGKWFYLEFNLRLFFYLLSQPFDIVCAVDLDTLLPAFAAGRLRGKPCVYDAHEYFTEVPEIVRRPAIRRIWAAIGRLVIPRLRYAYTVGPELAALLEKRYGTAFEVVRNLPLRQRNTLTGVAPEKPVILYQGTLNEGRGLEAAIAAMAWLPEAELWLAGEGDRSLALRRLVQETGLAHQVRFLGFLLPEALQQLTPKAAVGLNLLENKGLSYYYSLANKAFDYIQAGIPSLQMDFPEYRRINEEFGVFTLIPDLSPQTIAASVRRLLDDHEYYRRLQENCRRAARVLTWEAEQEILLGFYRRLCLQEGIALPELRK